MWKFPFARAITQVRQHPHMQKALKITCINAAQSNNKMTKKGRIHVIKFKVESQQQIWHKNDSSSPPINSAADILFPNCCPLKSFPGNEPQACSVHVLPKGGASPNQISKIKADQLSRTRPSDDTRFNQNKTESVHF